MALALARYIIFMFLMLIGFIVKSTASAVLFVHSVFFTQINPADEVPDPFICIPPVSGASAAFGA
jgi:hypothetical protein